MIAAHLENLLFLLLLVLAGLFQLLGRAARKTNGDEEESTPRPAPRMPKPIPRAPAESAQERIRKFLEALGQPPASTPPPPVVPRTNIPPRPLAPVQPPIPRAMTVAPAFEVHKGPLLVEQPSIIKTPVETYAAATRAVPKSADLKTDVAILLASKSGLRDAIILREIFGPPRSLQALDLL